MLIKKVLVTCFPLPLQSLLGLDLSNSLYVNFVIVVCWIVKISFTVEEIKDILLPLVPMVDHML